MLAKLSHIKKLLSSHRFDLTSEKILQREIEKVIMATGLPLQSEVRLSQESIIDFVAWDDIGIEVKLKGAPKAIFRQIKRYCEFESVVAIILITNRSISLPEAINDKPTLVINLGMAWL
jgi:hypothetical protein